MLRIALFTAVALIVSIAPAPCATLTHAIAVVRDMEAGRRAFAAAGFQIAPTRPISQDLLHAIIPFSDGTFLELLSARRRTQDTADIYQMTRVHDVWAGAGFEVPDVYARRARLVAHGFRMDPITVSPHWWDLDFADPAGVLSPFFLYTYHDVPAGYGKRYVPYRHHANGAAGLRGLDVAVEPGTHAAAIYANAGLRGVTPIENGAGDGRIVLVRLRSSNPHTKGRTIVVDGCRILFE